MKTGLVASIVAAMALLTPAMADSLRLIPLKGRVYVVEDDYYARENSIVYVGRDRVTVVGATWTPETAAILVGEIRKVTKLPVTEVIDTNHDPDRIGGNAYFRKIGAKIVSLTLTRDLLEKDGEAQIRQVQKSLPKYPSVPIVLPDTVYPGSFALQGGAVRVLYLGASHKPDDAFVWFPDEKVLYGGCALKPHLGNMEGADLVAYPKTLQKLKALHLPIETIVAGHYDAIHGPDLIDRYLELLAQYK